MSALFWFRRDRRLQDNEALNVAASEQSLHTIFVLPSDIGQLSPLRQASLIESARALSDSIPGGLNVLAGDTAAVLEEFVKRNAIGKVYATRAYDTEGMREQSDVAEREHDEPNA